MYKQVAYVAACVAYVFVVTAGIAKIMDLVPFLSLRATEQAEIIGMDEDQVSHLSTSSHPHLSNPLTGSPDYAPSLVNLSKISSNCAATLTRGLVPMRLRTLTTVSVTIKSSTATVTHPRRKPTFLKPSRKNESTRMFRLHIRHRMGTMHKITSACMPLETDMDKVINTPRPDLLQVSSLRKPPASLRNYGHILVALDGGQMIIYLIQNVCFLLVSSCCLPRLCSRLMFQYISQCICISTTTRLLRLSIFVW